MVGLQDLVKRLQPIEILPCAADAICYIKYIAGDGETVLVEVHVLPNLSDVAVIFRANAILAAQS